MEIPGIWAPQRVVPLVSSTQKHWSLALQVVRTPPAPQELAPSGHVPCPATHRDVCGSPQSSAAAQHPLPHFVLPPLHFFLRFFRFRASACRAASGLAVTPTSRPASTWPNSRREGHLATVRSRSFRYAVSTSVTPHPLLGDPSRGGHPRQTPEQKLASPESMQKVPRSQSSSLVHAAGAGGAPAQPDPPPSSRGRQPQPSGQSFAVEQLQAPWMQPPEAQALPQAPQLSPSLARSAQTSPQSVVPIGQTQPPLMQAPAAGQSPSSQQSAQTPSQQRCSPQPPQHSVSGMHCLPHFRVSPLHFFWRFFLRLLAPAGSPDQRVSVANEMPSAAASAARRGTRAKVRTTASNRSRSI